MLSGSWERYAPLSGLLFVALVVVSIIVTGGDSVDSDDSTQKVVEFWTSNDSEQIAGALLGALALVPFLWFLGSLRKVLRTAEGGTGRLSAVAFAGGIVLAAGAAADASIQFAAADSADKVPPGVTQALSVLYSDFFLVFPVGVAPLMLATALVILRTRVLPVWLGWVALVVGIVAVTPAGFFAFLVVLVWVAVVSVLLFQREPRPTPTAVPGPS
jgi:hypothetical protein